LNSQTKAHLGLLGTNLFFAINYSAVKYFTSNHYAGPFGLNIIRIGISLILFWILFLFNPAKKKIYKKDIPAFLLCALTAIALNQMLFIKGLSLTFPIHASLLTLITPIMITIIAARILRERITIPKLIGLLLGVLGALLLITTREASAPGDNILLGDILVISSAMAYTFYFILVKPLMQKYSSLHVMRWVFTFGFFMVLPLSAKEFSNITWDVFTLKDWGLLFIITIPGTFFAYLFNVYGIKTLSASTAGAYIYSQPVFAVIVSMVFLKEHLSIYKILAALLIFGGVYLSNRKPAKEVMPGVE
jgi:drug/metabolite transporter (DMT)-like permease